MLIPPNPHLTASFVNCTITCEDTDFKFVHQTRLLGIIVDSALSWSAQVDNVCRKVGRKIGALRRSFRQLTQYARRKFLLSVIQPDLEYAAFVYVPLMSVGLRSQRPCQYMPWIQRQWRAHRNTPAPFKFDQLFVGWGILPKLSPIHEVIMISCRSAWSSWLLAAPSVYLVGSAACSCEIS